MDDNDGEADFLVVATNHREYPSAGETTGLWLAELVHFAEVVEEAGHDYELVSPEGGEVPLDESSLSFFAMDASCRRAMEDDSFRTRLEETASIDEVDADAYDGIYLTGGHGTMWDFPESAPLREVLEQMWADGRVVSAVCHGVSGLLEVRQPDGEHLIADRDVTGFSNFEEKLLRLTDDVPFLLEDELVRRGADYDRGWIPFTSTVVTDGRLVTGQNPGSTEAVARATLEALDST